MKSSSPRLLITGGNGQLARSIVYHPQSKKAHVHAYSRAECDITDIAALHNAINACEPDVIVNTAAYTAVDNAERETEKCVRVNHLGAMNLAIVCRKENIPLIHISTDYVFDGKKKAPYLETDKINPVNFYGKSKWLGEEAVREHCPSHVILRVSGVFSTFGNNFFKTILRLAKERPVLRVVCDQITCPTSADDVASAIYKICHHLKQKHWGTYHYCSNKPVSWFEFASNILYQAQHYKSLSMQEIQAITTSEYATLASRPEYSVLSCKKIKKNFGVEQKSWESAVKLLIQTGEWR